MARTKDNKFDIAIFIAICSLRNRLDPPHKIGSFSEKALQAIDS